MLACWNRNFARTTTNVTDVKTKSPARVRYAADKIAVDATQSNAKQAPSIAYILLGRASL